MSYAKILLVGNLGKPLEARATKNGSTIFTGSIATSHKWKDKAGQKQEKTTWHKITIFNEALGMFLSDHTKAGSKLFVEGRPDIEDWEKDGVKRQTAHVVVDSVQILSGWVESSSQPEHSRYNENGTQKSPYAPLDEAFDDDIPF